MVEEGWGHESTQDCDHRKHKHQRPERCGPFITWCVEGDEQRSNCSFEACRPWWMVSRDPNVLQRFAAFGTSNSILSANDHENVASPRCCLGTCRKNENRIEKEQWPQKRALRYSKKARHIFTQSDFLASNMACYRQHISHWCSSKFMTVPSHQDS